MRDHRGLEWMRVSEVLERRPSLTRSRVDVWVHRRRIRSMRIDREVWICWQDVLAQERAAARFSRGPSGQ